MAKTKMRYALAYIIYSAIGTTIAAPHTVTTLSHANKTSEPTDKSIEILSNFSREKRRQNLAQISALSKSEIRSNGSTLSRFNQEQVPLVRLTRDILSPARYDIRARPVADYQAAVKIHLSMSLYQLIEVNEPSQSIKVNMWMIQKWRDDSLDWDPNEYEMINSTILPYDVLWTPDTYLYNSVVMASDETEKYMNIRADSLFWQGRRGSNMSFLYPAIYTVTCRLNIRYFPYDQQNCTLTIGSWTNSKSTVDYIADDRVNMASYIENEEWDVMSFRIHRHEYKYACCPEPWVILEASIILRRKPLYYLINLVVPTSIITLVAITGFFTPASTADDRTEKINLGITTLLAMSILMLMVSGAMPSTSEFVPLIAWFYLSIIVIISIGTFLTSIILGIQSRRQYGELPTKLIRYWIMARVRVLLCLRVPSELEAIWEELNDRPSMAFQKQTENDTKPYHKNNNRREQSYKTEGTIDENVVTLCDEHIISPKMKKLEPRQTNACSNWNRIIGKIIRQNNIKKNAKNFGATMRPSLVISTMIDDVCTPLSFSPSNSDMISLSIDATDEVLTFEQIPAHSGHKFCQEFALDNGALSPRVTSNVQSSSLKLKRRKSSSLSALSLQINPTKLKETPLQQENYIVPRPSQERVINKTNIAPSKNKFLRSSAPKRILSEVTEMRRRRQCSLEWEFIATILDRVFLILFNFAVLSITAALMITGLIAQASYESE